MKEEHLKRLAAIKFKEDKEKADRAAEQAAIDKYLKLKEETKAREDADLEAKRNKQEEKENAEKRRLELEKLNLEKQQKLENERIEQNKRDGVQKLLDQKMNSQ